jgi:flavin reductase (DIM6/NTAB) family NADH-FMN oxidoreductase RutF
MTTLDFDALPPQDRYKLLSALVIPRPVAWICTVSATGVANAAPYSFFNVFGEAPALVVLGLQHRADGAPKDTTANIRRSGEFVICLATPALTDAMVATAAAYPPETGEPAALGLATAPSLKVAPPRLADAPVAMECRRLTALTFGPTRELLVGEVVALHARPGLIDPDTLRVDWAGDYPVARLFADRYARLEEIDRRAIPTLPA